MAHFAKIDDNNEVLTVLTVNDADVKNESNVETESVGQAYLQTHNNWPSEKWIQCSRNTRKNVHVEGGTAFRGNYPSIGYTWDPVNEIFWPPQPYSSWTKDTSTASWIAPITYPSILDDGTDTPAWTYTIYWNEDAYQADNTTGWEAYKEGNTPVDQVHKWNGTAWIAQ